MAKEIDFGIPIDSDLCAFTIAVSVEKNVSASALFLTTVGCEHRVTCGRTILEMNCRPGGANAATSADGYNGFARGGILIESDVCPLRVGDLAPFGRNPRIGGGGGSGEDRLAAPECSPVSALVDDDRLTSTGGVIEQSLSAVNSGPLRA